MCGQSVVYLPSVRTFAPAVGPDYVILHYVISHSPNDPFSLAVAALVKNVRGAKRLVKRLETQYLGFAIVYI